MEKGTSLIFANQKTDSPFSLQNTFAATVDSSQHTGRTDPRQQVPSSHQWRAHSIPLDNSINNGITELLKAIERLKRENEEK